MQAKAQQNNVIIRSDIMFLSMSIKLLTHGSFHFFNRKYL